MNLLGSMYFYTLRRARNLPPWHAAVSVLPEWCDVTRFRSDHIPIPKPVDFNYSDIYTFYLLTTTISSTIIYCITEWDSTVISDEDTR